MTEPKLTVLGVYRPQISAETWKEQWAVTENDDHTREHFDGLVLIEAVIDDPTEPFDIGRFGQMNLASRDVQRQMPCGYDEGLLSADGETLIERRMDCLDGSGRSASPCTCISMMRTDPCSGKVGMCCVLQCRMRPSG